MLSPSKFSVLVRTHLPSMGKPGKIFCEPGKYGQLLLENVYEHLNMDNYFWKIFANIYLHTKTFMSYEPQ